MAADEEVLKRRYREFLDLLPLTTAIAGLPESQGSFNFSAEQMELRTQTLLTAFKLSKGLIREVLGGV